MWGGVTCIRPSDIKKYGNDCEVIIATVKQHWDHIIKELEEMEVLWTTFDHFVLSRNAQRIEKIADTYFEDPFSARVYRKIIEYRTGKCDILDSELITDQVYFCLPQFQTGYTEQEVFVDAGAFCGDTIERFLMYRLDAFGKIYAFEPGEKQFGALTERVRRLNREWALDEGKVVLKQAALSDRNGYCRMADYVTNCGAFISGVSDQQHQQEVPVYAVDVFIDGRVDFIKADVEGAELELLKGACNTIRKYKPRLAVCLYHRPYDLFEIPEYIKSLVPEYKMMVRHHSAGFCDTVLYCFTE